MRESAKLKRSYVLAVVTLLFALTAAATATFAWYIHTVNARTTKLHMAAGTNVELQISDRPDTGFKSAAPLKAFRGTLTPVSTNRIQNGFRRVEKFTADASGTPKASWFAEGVFSETDERSDYYKTTLYFRTNGGKTEVYLWDIGFEDGDESAPISSAVRVGFVIPATGQEHIFEITDKKNPGRSHNTLGVAEDGWVLDPTKTEIHEVDAAETNGAAVPFTPLDRGAYCLYDTLTGAVTLQYAADGTAQSVPLCTVEGRDGGYGEPVQVDIYIWLEGCDGDCTGNLARKTLKNLSLNFAGLEEAGT